jgi:competence protein ComEC
MLAREYNLKADVLKVGHHGSNSATPADFPKAGSPKYAVISCGLNNDYGHPHQETLTKLNAAGTKIYRTDLNGIITLKSTGSTISISTEK